MYYAKIIKCPRSMHIIVIIIYHTYVIMIVHAVPMLAHVSGFHSFSRPPLHPLTSRGERGEGRTPREVMEVPCEWAPSTVWGGREGGEERGGREEGRVIDIVA